MSEKGVVVLMHLCYEFFYGNTAQLGNFGIEFCDGMLSVVVSFQKKSVEGTGNQGFGVETGTETEVKVVEKKLLELFGIAAIAVPYPWLLGMEFLANSKNVVDGAHAMQKEGQLELFAEFNFLAKYFYLQGIWCGADTVETAFADG